MPKSSRGGEMWTKFLLEESLHAKPYSCAGSSQAASAGPPERLVGFDADKTPAEQKYQATHDLISDVHLTHECFAPESGFRPEGALADCPCTKNPGHSKFIPMSRFCKEDLPAHWMHDLMFEFVKIWSRLTVRITGTLVSKDRPQGFLQPKMAPGKRLTFYGTGYVGPEPEMISPCDCSTCQNKEGTVVYEIPIKTANHVIFDQEEADKASTEFYGDDSDNSSSRMTLPIHSVQYNYKEWDSAKYICTTHDEKLFQTIKEDYRKARELHEHIMAATRGQTQPYTFIVSHPHGYGKHVSFGKECFYIPEGDSAEGYTGYFQYDTPTCPGSSGAQVLGDLGFGKAMHGASNYIHHGIDKASKGFNRSSSYRQYR